MRRYIAFIVPLTVFLFICSPSIAYANCAAESFAVAQIGFERIPGDQIARQMYEMRRSQAYSALAACTENENRRRSADRAVERAREQSAAAPRAAKDAIDQVPVQPTLDQIVANLKNERLTKAVSRAIADGRCKDAKFIALRQSRLDLAEQALKLCEPSGFSPKVPSGLQAIDRGAWITSNDYPLAALQERRQGRTLISFEVSEEGFVENCVVTTSSGYADLDRMACIAVEARGLFIPPTDTTNKRIRTRGQDSINWILN